MRTAVACFPANGHRIPFRTNAWTGMFSLRGALPGLAPSGAADGFATPTAAAASEAASPPRAQLDRTPLGASRGAERNAPRVIRALDARRIGVVVLVTLLLSAEVLSSPQLLAFFSPVEIALAWL